MTIYLPRQPEIGSEPFRLPYNITPNPATNVLVLSDIDAAGVYQIANLNGQVMLSGSLSAGSININISSLLTGNYFVDIKCVNGNMASLQFEKR